MFVFTQQCENQLKNVREEKQHIDFRLRELEKDLNERTEMINSMQQHLDLVQSENRQLNDKLLVSSY